MSLWKNKAPLITLYKRTNLKAQQESFKKYFNRLPRRKKALIRYILNKKRGQKHRLHVVSPSPWPIYSATCAFLFVIGMVLWMHGYTSIPLICGTLGIISAFVFWFRDIIREGLYMGYHTRIVNACLRLGFILFLVSEVMFFFGFFWALFHYTLTPSIFSGGVWPPQGIALWILNENVNSPTNRAHDIIKLKTPTLVNEFHETDTLFWNPIDFDLLIETYDVHNRTKRKPLPWRYGMFNYFYMPNPFITFIFKRICYGHPGSLYWNHSIMYINLYSRGVLINPYKIPLLNTAILITSGFVLTLSHSYIRTEIFRACYRTLIFTICLGLLFISLQAKEYIYSGFSMNDGVYGSIFYMLTGFHGFHVIIGTIFLIVIAFRVRLSHFTHNNHFAFEAAAWYWHFVDVIWILLYLLLYLWPNAYFFSPKSNLIILPAEDSLVMINMSVDYYFKHLNKDPNFSFSTSINFEYHLDKKAKVVSEIIKHFEKDILKYEDTYEFDLNKLRRNQWRRLCRKIKHW